MDGRARESESRESVLAVYFTYYTHPFNGINLKKVKPYARGVITKYDKKRISLKRLSRKRLL